MSYNIGLGTSEIPNEKLYRILCEISSNDDDSTLIIDTAMAYNSETTIGNYIYHYPQKRKKLFIIDKINYSNQIVGVKKSLESSLKKLKIDSLDLLCIHSPRFPDYKITWKEMEKVKDEGLVKHIGLSNFYATDLQQIISISNHSIYSNQISLDFNNQSTDQLIKLCQTNNISIQICMVFKRALANNQLVEILNSISKRHKVSIYQIIISWLVCHKFIPIIGTSSYEHFTENNALVALNDIEMSLLNSIAPF